MRIALFSLFLIFSLGVFAQMGTDKECRTNVMLDVVIDTLPRPNCDCIYNPFRLKPLNNKYHVVSFSMFAEISDDETAEAQFEGEWISPKGISILREAKRGTEVFFECIKARHENGNVYVLKSFSIRK